MVSTVVASPAPVARADVRVEVVRVPHGGLQPEVAIDQDGGIHLVYLAGEPGKANVFYVRSPDGGRSFSPPIRVNSENGRAIATGTIRGAQLALGRSRRIHVAWNGSPGPSGMAMLYTRSQPGATAFETERNLMTHSTTLDGGGSIAADDAGHVYVAWHANAAGGQPGEQARRVWLATSDDDGGSFAKEVAISNPSTGVCGCCALRLVATARGELQLLYRAATDLIHRDIYALTSHDGGRRFTSARVHGWDVGACPMSSMSITTGPRGLHAWETDGQVYFTSAERGGVIHAPPPGTTADAQHRKHPRLAVSDDGTSVLLAWTEGTGWARGGSLAWRVFDAQGRPTAVHGTAPGVPVWSFAAAAARRDGSFVIFY